jgi:hypothetical protein
VPKNFEFLCAFLKARDAAPCIGEAHMIWLDRAKRKVLRWYRELSQKVERRALADIWKANDANLQALENFREVSSAQPTVRG